MAQMDAVTIEHGRAGRLWRLARRATAVGLVASLLVHLMAALLAAIWTIEYSPADAGGSGAEVVDFAIMSEAELAELSDQTVQVSATHAPDLAGPDLSELELAADSSGGQIDTLITELVEVDIAAGGGDVLSGDTSEAAAGGGGLSGTGASFFGVEAQGNRFAFIVDVSSSMRAEGKMDQTKQELARSVSALAETSEVVIVLYSNGPIPLTDEVEWVRADQRNKIHLRRLIMGIEPGGSTNPLGAFEWVFRLNPLPDAVYFMTDGQFDSTVPTEVKRMNGRRRIPVHCIMFGQIGNAQARSQVEDMLRRISRESGGRFKHVEAQP